MKLEVNHHNKALSVKALTDIIEVIIIYIYIHIYIFFCLKVIIVLIDA